MVKMANCTSSVPRWRRGLGLVKVEGAKCIIVFLTCAEIVPIVVIYCSKLKSLKLVHKYRANRRQIIFF